MSRALVSALLLAVALLAGCGLTAREVVTASLEGANAAIVAAASEVDAEEQRQEAACMVAAGDVDACIAQARKLNTVLDAYNRYASMWSVFRLIYNAVSIGKPSAEASAAAAQLGCSAVDEACVARAQGRVESARAEFYAAKAIAGGS